MSRRMTGRGRRSAAGPLVTLPAPRLWYNFDAANVTKDGSNLISQVNDLSGNAEHMLQGTGTRQPLWVNDGAPGGTTDRADFVPDGVQFKTMSRSPAGAPFGLAGYTVLLAFNRVTATTPNWVMWSYNNGAARGGWSLQTSSGANGRRFEARTSAGTVKSCTFGDYTVNTPEVWCISNSGGGADDVDSTATFTAEVNGVSQTVTGSPWFWIMTGAFAENFGFSSAVAGNELRMYEAIMYDSVLSPAQRLRAQRLMGVRHGITVA